MKKRDKYLLDTSAIFAFWNDEPGADEVDYILQKAGKEKVDVFVSFMCIMEAYYRLWKNQGEEAGRDIYLSILSLPIQRINLTEHILLKAVEIKATNNLSVADSWIIATAIENQAILVHKDPEFEQVKETVELKNLPYKV